MKNLCLALWNDEKGFVVTAEAALLATVGIVGATVGMKMAAHSVNEELQEVAESFRSLDQSYAYRGFQSCTAYTAGSCYEQPPVERSLKELRQRDEHRKAKRAERKRNKGNKSNRGKSTGMRKNKNSNSSKTESKSDSGENIPSVI